VSELPTGWAVAEGRDLFRFVRGVSFAKQQAASTPFAGSVGILRAGNIQKGELSFEDLIYVPATCVSDEQRLRKGDLVIAMSSGSASVVGKVALCTADHHGKVSFGAFCGVLRPHDVTIADWLAEYFRTTEYRQIISGLAAGVSINNLRADYLLSLSIPIPPRGTLSKSRDLLGAARRRSRATRAHLDRARELVEHFRQSVLAAAFRGDLTAAWREKNPDVEPASVLLTRIREERRYRWEEAELAKTQAKGKASGGSRSKDRYVDPDHNDVAGLPELPDSWRWAALEGLTDPLRLIRYGMLMPGPSVPGGRPYVKVMHMRGDVIDTSNLPTTTDEMWNAFAGAALAKGDILLSIRGTYGRVASVPDALEGANITQDSARIAPMPGVHREFLATILRSPYAQTYLRRVAKGVAVKGVNIQDIRPMAIPVAPLTEQIAIAQSVATTLQGVRATESAIADATAHLDVWDSVILARAFRGELVSGDSNDEPASVLLGHIQRGQDLRPVPSRPRVRTPRAPKEKSTMAKSRFDDDVFHKPYLMEILVRSGGSLRAQELFSRADLMVADFYKQLVWEVDQSHINEVGDELVTAHAN
jgi:type I restriction enzyme S subunit